MSTLTTLLELTDRLTPLAGIPEARLTRGNINRVLSAKSESSRKEILATLEINELEREKVRLILEILSHPEFEELIDEGHVTFGMVKPHRDQAIRIQGGTDEENTEKLLAAIQPPLQVVIRQDLFFPREMMEAFYAHLRPIGEGDIFNRVVHDMSSQATTGLVIFHPTGDAIQEWREQIGPTGAKPEEPGETLRHRFGAGIKNNAAHGSDSIENVKHELGFFKELLASLSR